MSTFLVYTLIYVIGELIALIVFQKLDRNFRKVSKPEGEKNIKYKFMWMPVFKGLLERFFIYVSLINDLHSALTVFGALKLGTRLEDDKKVKVSNDYFFVGNLISVLFALGYYFMAMKLLATN
jgi:hypothetical protein